MISLWSDTTELPSFPKLDRDINTDVLIIGGGITGILCAKLLRDADVDCVVVEKGKICGGVTKNTTAKITAQHGLIYSRLIEELGHAKAQMYLRANLDAVESFAEMCKDIDCGFERKDAFLYSQDKTQALEDEIKALNSIGGQAEIVDCSLSFMKAVGVRMTNQAQFKPLKFLAAVAKELSVFEDTRIISVDGGTAFGDNFKIEAKNIIVATHFPFINTRGLYSLKMYQERSYVLALENACDIGGIYTPADNNGVSMRNCSGLLLVGGFGARTGSLCGGWDALGGFVRDNLPDAREKYRWAAQDCMTLDCVPYIGRYSKCTPQMYVATGFNKWGMTSSLVSASVLRDMILHGRSEYGDLFSPHRSMFKKQLFINGFKYVSSLLTPFGPRCPHLGCRLKYNRAEHSWDCPCHGSRFGEDGRLLNEPATGDKQMKNERKM